MPKYFFFLCAIFIIAAGEYKYRKAIEILHTFAQKLVTTEGEITDYCHNPHALYPHEYTMTTTQLSVDSMVYPVSTTVTIRTKESGDFTVGDQIVCHKIMVYGVKSTRSFFYFLRTQRLTSHHCLTLAQIDTTLIYRPYWSIHRWLVAQRNRAIEQLRNHLNPDAFALCTTLFFGKKLGEASAHERLQEAYLNWGIVHYLARSGLHVALLATLWRMLFLPLPFILRELLLLLCIIVYGLISWNSASFVRAYVMFALNQYCRITLRTHSGLYIWCLTLMLMLCYNPFEVGALDFQLTFLLTGALLLFFERQHAEKLLQKKGAIS